MRIAFMGDGAKWRFEESSSICVPPGVESIEISISDLSVTLEFRSDPEKEDGTLEQVGVSDQSLALALINFTNPLGTAWTSRIGTYGGRELHLSLFLSVIGHPSPFRHLTYSFFTKEPA